MAQGDSADASDSDAPEALPGDGSGWTARDAPPDPLTTAEDLRRRGDPVAAEQALRDLLASRPGDGAASGLLAELLEELGRPLEAARHYRAALIFDPRRGDWHRALARCFEAVGEADRAVESCVVFLQMRPDDAPTHRRLARLLLARGERTGALAHAREARFLTGDDLPGLSEIATVLIAAEEPAEALELLEPPLRRSPPGDRGRGLALVASAEAWGKLGEADKARDALGRAQHEPDVDAERLAQAYAALGDAGGELTPLFVRTLFDRYADRFDVDLVDKLAYRAPQALRMALECRGLSAGAGLRFLDAGCGTGLAGVEVRSMAARLVGIDLSPRMVEKARARGIYDDLRVGVLPEALFQTGGSWDVILFADVLVYLGDLRPVLAAAAGVLVRGGLIALTLERQEDDGFALAPSRRYRHGKGHLIDAATRAGLSVDVLEDFVPRLDRGAPVPGLLAILSRS